MGREEGRGMKEKKRRGGENGKRIQGLGGEIRKANPYAVRE